MAVGPSSRGGSGGKASLDAIPVPTSSAPRSPPRGAHAVSPPPSAPPPFGVAELRAAIPKELFERSAFWSFVHLGFDFVKIGLTGLAMSYLDAAVLPMAVKALGWLVLWYLQGAFMTGVWVIAHECGHQAFSDYKWLNDGVGLVLVRERGGAGSWRRKRRNTARARGNPRARGARGLTRMRACACASLLVGGSAA